MSDAHGKASLPMPAQKLKALLRAILYSLSFEGAGMFFQTSFPKASPAFILLLMISWLRLLSFKQDAKALKSMLFSKNVQLMSQFSLCECGLPLAEASTNDHVHIFALLHQSHLHPLHLYEQPPSVVPASACWSWIFSV